MSFRTATLSSAHYAHDWKIATSESMNDHEDVNRLAIEYASLEDGPDKEAKCLEIIQCFHGYLMKYLNMIVRGHLPSLKTPAGKDASKMLATLVPAGKKVNRETLLTACRTLHLAFKQQSADDIYDTLVMCLMRAIRKYDPFYTDKVKVVVEAIDAQHGKRDRRKRDDGGLVLEPEISTAVGFDSSSYLRMLVRRGNLASIVEPKRKKVVGYRRTRKWPPSAEFLGSGPVGFVYFLPMYFRYYLHEHISASMSSIESKEGVLQLEHRSAHIGSPGVADVDVEDRGIPHADGAFVDHTGTAWAADLTLVNLQLDISEMSNGWVQDCPDKLFKKLTVRERYILKLRFHDELSWEAVASVLDSDVPTVRRAYEQIMNYLRARVHRRK